MTPDLLVECELSKVDWSRVAEVTGPATKIPDALRELLAATTPEAATTAYWKLENHVVVQGHAFEAALHVVPVIMAALVDSTRPFHVRISLLELLFQIVYGNGPSENGFADPHDIQTRCQVAARQGLWLLYREVVFGCSESAIEILEVLDDDPMRLAFVKQQLESGQGP